ncbi:MAG: 50S ribosomal protein L32 [Candidatus Goldbacteria bacterium]|nr:50S ribosomal protein L32 [Candidatus Goldiibacteriota bacterium]PKL92662.1 MAG: 50S ribosomal protein L32 [Candidatus Goldiibacteriota bacterium HGW-Goldbacteria-1]
MANLTWRTSKSKTRSRKAANMKLSQNINLTECPNCHAKKEQHRVCKSCGHYNGKEVISSEE